MRKLYALFMVCCMVAFVFAFTALAFAAGEPFADASVTSMYTQGAGVWTYLQYPVYLALGIAFVLFIVRKGKGWIMGLFRRG